MDPLVDETGQPYAYTGDDPVNGIDPLGLSWFDPSWAHKAVHRLARGADKVGHFVATHKKAAIAVATVIATLPLDETGIGEAIDADVLGSEGTAEATADVVGDVEGEAAPEFFGGRGLSSSRDFDPAGAGGPIESLDASTADVTDEGVDSVAQHLQRFVPDGQLEAPEQGMLGRLSAIASGHLEPTEYDLNFYTHELDEARRYAQLGYSEGDISGSDMYETF